MEALNYVSAVHEMGTLPVKFCYIIQKHSVNCAVPDIYSSEEELHYWKRRQLAGGYLSSTLLCFTLFLFPRPFSPPMAPIHKAVSFFLCVQVICPLAILQPKMLTSLGKRFEKATGKLTRAL